MAVAAVIQRGAAAIGRRLLPWALPIALVIGLNFMWPGYFTPLTNSIAGYLIVIVCGSLWIAAIFVARQILDVDI